MKKITKQKLRISNLPKLFKNNWFEKTWCDGFQRTKTARRQHRVGTRCFVAVSLGCL
ncbi:hypothetical protein [Vibrio xiamenensis]|uniref:hypothetical protein n=1 Tax=Vibrio xiamenensis TaxID=861298 RepID=UPI0015A3EB71|nr:hypothetical protein [Vibrio xiamenensis]